MGESMKIWAIKKDLKRPLDKWYKSGKDLHSECQSYYNYKLNSLYIRTSEGYIRYTQDIEQGNIFVNREKEERYLTDTSAPVHQKSLCSATMLEIPLRVYMSLRKDIDRNQLIVLMAFVVPQSATLANFDSGQVYGEPGFGSGTKPRTAGPGETGGALLSLAINKKSKNRALAKLNQRKASVTNERIDQ